MKPTSHITISARSLQTYSVVFASFLALALQGCNSDGTDGGDGGSAGGGGQQNCQTSFTQTINPDPNYVDDAQHRHFRSQDMAFLVDPNNEIDTIQFQMNLQGQYTGYDGEVQLSVNGVRVYDAQPTSAYSCSGFFGSDNHSNCGFEMDMMTMNGAQPVQNMFNQILGSKGEIEVEVQGNARTCQMNQGSIVVTGRNHAGCASPTPTPTVCSSNALAISGSMEGNLSIAPGDTIDVGYDFTMPGSHSAATVDVTDGSVTVNVECPDGSVTPLLATLPGQTYSESASESDWLPSSEQDSSLVFQGSIVAPKTLCSGRTGHAPNGAAFSAIFTSTDTKDPVNARFHYEDHSAGGWSGTVSTTPTCAPQPSPTPTATPTPSPSPSPSPVPSPSTTITAENPSAPLTNSTSMSISFTSNQVGVSFACSLDGATATACTSPQLYSGLASGTHTFKVAATNSVGETDPVGASYSWTVDTTAPVITITNAASLPTITNQTSITLDFTSTNDFAAVAYTCTLDTATSSSCASPMTYTGLAAGQHQVSISGIDAAGNVSATSATFQWTIDLTPPVVSFVSIVPGNSPTNSTGITFTFTSNKTSTLACSLDGAAYSTCTSPTTFSALEQGSHTFAVQATDLAGNVSVPATYAWTIDLTPPVLTLGQVMPAEGYSNANMISVEFASDKPVTATCTLDGVATSGCTSPFTASITAAGEHDFEVSAVDLAGNASNVLSVSWIMDYIPPQISWGAMIPSTASYINATSFQAAVNVTTEAPATLACSVNGTALPETASPITLNSLADATSYDVQAVATDEAGNVSNTLDHSFTVDLVAPIVSLSASINGLTNQTMNSFTFSATAETSVTFECELDGGGFSPCSSPMAASGASDGAHIYQVEAIDLAGNVSQAASLTWTVDTVPPVTTLTESQSSDTSMSFTFTADAESAVTFQCSLDGAAAASCTSPLAYNGLSVGSHVFTVQATDAAGNVEVSPPSYTWTVSPAVSTTITSESVGSITNQTAISLAFTSNLSTATFQCSLDGSAAAPCSSPFAVSGLAAGVHTFFVQAIDGWGNADPVGATFQWTIDLTHPVTTLTESQTANTSMTFIFTASEASTFQCTLDGTTSSCASPDMLTGLSAGSHTFSVQATDLAGNAEISPPSYTWTVYPTESTSITNLASLPASPYFSNATSLSFSFAASVPGSTFQCSLNGSMPTTCASPYTASGLTNGSYTFKVQAIDPWGAVDPTGATYAWTEEVTPPGVTSFSVSVGTTSITLNWTTSDATTTSVNWGIGSSLTHTVNGAAGYSTSHSVMINGLSPSTSYSVEPAGSDQAGNSYTYGPKSERTN